ncbi:uncharacterized protein LACBIDRAFT_325571 [Laccaria bicolor S238N-H82]|uniref:Predicted protein n=1 Tax=Laccaria bicolor (strain S238N-H82 / ATCC MYA-4686) TaxID=486041 RepID=B0D5I0_LACBS|nr:uncharacterized protein LACBIDRAFT_325571 [Laccaria bicolor S238N-H82]EDR10026.1 predicted protein [Laccaria bicolor S238N-H82]|eukprot:XP_001879411.1 predicted protein [Laccaria bicolor S238N-H82]
MTDQAAREATQSSGIAYPSAYQKDYDFSTPFLTPFFHDYGISRCNLHLILATMNHENHENNSGDVNQRTIAAQKLVDDVVNQRSPYDLFMENLRAIRISSVEGEDYVQQVNERMRLQGDGGGSAQPLPAWLNVSSSTQPSHAENPSAHPSCSSTPEGLTAEELLQFKEHRQELLKRPNSTNQGPNDVSEDIAWALLRAKINQTHSALGTQPTSYPLDDIIKLLNVSPSSSATIPASVLSAAPHLSALSEHTFLDSHLQTTWKLRQSFNSDKAIDPIIDLMQLQPLVDPIPRPLWRAIIQDQYVDFEKLHASMDRGFSHNDDAKDFAGGFSLVRKDQYSARKVVRNEAEWARVFQAWKAGVVLLYPHRLNELNTYQDMVIELFRAAPYDPFVTINVDAEARDRYARSPYQMDDRSRFQLPLLSQMLRKREATDTMGPSKRANMGFVPNAEESTKLETTKRASLLSKLAVEKDLAQATRKAEEAILEGPKALPRNSTKRQSDTIIDPPRFRRRLKTSSFHAPLLSKIAGVRDPFDAAHTVGNDIYFYDIMSWRCPGCI